LTSRKPAWRTFSQANRSISAESRPRLAGSVLEHLTDVT
jgi:hypothetical protein